MTVSVTAAVTVSVTSTRPGTVSTGGPGTVLTIGAGTVSTTRAVISALPTGGITVATVAMGRTGTLAPTGARSVLTFVTGADAGTGPRVPPVPELGAPPSARPVPVGGGEMPAVTTAVAVAGTGSAGRLGRWVGGTLRRGHRPIIARTRGALCSPRQNCR